MKSSLHQWSHDLWLRLVIFSTIGSYHQFWRVIMNNGNSQQYLGIYGTSLAKSSSRGYQLLTLGLLSVSLWCLAVTLLPYFRVIPVWHILCMYGVHSLGHLYLEVFNMTFLAGSWCYLFLFIFSPTVCLSNSIFCSLSTIITLYHYILYLPLNRVIMASY